MSDAPCTHPGGSSATAPLDGPRGGGRQRVELRALGRTAATSLALALVAGLSVRALAPIGTLSAAQRGPQCLDCDGDGLPNALEEVHGTSPLLADTDGDGFEDAMEFALGSDPRDPASVPQRFEHSLDLVPYVEQGVFHLTQVLYAPAGQIGGVAYALSHYKDGVMTPLPPEVYLATATLHAVGAGPRGDIVVLLTTSVPVSLIEQFGPHSFIAAAAAPGAPSPTTAAGTTLKPIDGVMHEAIDAAQFGVPEGGNAYIPLQVDLPGNFLPGQICLQESVIVGSSGPMIVHEINASDCVAADAFCSGAACQGQKGTTFEVLDPLALIGG